MVGSLIPRKEIMSAEFPCWAIRDPDGDLNHTTVAIDKEDAIEQFLGIERTMFLLCNSARVAEGNFALTCTPSWEVYEAEGYSVVPVKLVTSGSELFTPDELIVIRRVICSAASREGEDVSGLLMKDGAFRELPDDKLVVLAGKLEAHGN
jgi:hypothetical protein